MYTAYHLSYASNHSPSGNQCPEVLVLVGVQVWYMKVECFTLLQQEISAVSYPKHPNNIQTLYASWYPETSKNIQTHSKLSKHHPKIIQNHPTTSKIIQKSSKLCIFLWSTSWNDVKPRACSPKPGGNGSPWHLSAGKLMISVPYQRYLAEGYIRFIYLILRGYNWDYIIGS